MKRKFYYNNGLPFGDKLAENLIELDKRIEGKKASMLVVDGGVGEGKTTLAVEIADYINMLHGMPKIEFSEQLATGGKEFTQKLRKCYEKKLPVLIYDEAGDFNRRGSLTRFNSMLNRTFETFRAFQILVILCLPNFDKLDQYLFDNHIPRLLVHLSNRGDNYGNYSCFGLYRMLLLKSRMSKLNIKNYAYAMIDPNFRGHFLDLDPDRSKQLDKLTIKNKINILQKSEVEIEGLIGYKDLAQKLNRSHENIRRLVGELKLKPKRTINRVKYFDNSIIDVLGDYMDEKAERGKK